MEKIKMDDLDYEKHLEDYKKLFGYYVDNPYTKKEEQLKYIEKKAQELHYLSVFNPLRDWFIRAVTIAPKLKSDEARYYMQYGAGRRFSMIFYAYQAITHIVHPERTEPLSHEEQMELSQSINIIYMNLRGVLDNFAWCFMYERTPDLVDKIHANDIGLFSKKFRKQCSAFSSIEQKITIHDTWEKEVKERRDPVAHRIPLYVPHTIVTAQEAERYNELNSQFHGKAAVLDFESSDAAFAQMHEVGTFFPYFVHHPTEPCIPIYPTIPTDMAHLIRISDAVEEGLFIGT